MPGKLLSDLHVFAAHDQRRDIGVPQAVQVGRAFGCFLDNNSNVKIGLHHLPSVTVPRHGKDVLAPCFRAKPDSQQDRQFAGDGLDVLPSMFGAFHE